MHDALAAHPSRTRNKSEALLFYVPIWVATSYRVGMCGNGTRSHRHRMAAAAVALLSSPTFRSNACPRSRSTSPGCLAPNSVGEKLGMPAGFDHVYAHTANGWPHVSVRLGKLSPLLWGVAISGVERAYNPIGIHRLTANARCSVEVPLVANAHSWPAGLVAGVTPRPVLLYFSGSIRVCMSPRDSNPRPNQMPA